jgi:hypothetical protein
LPPRFAASDRLKCIVTVLVEKVLHLLATQRTKQWQNMTAQSQLRQILQSCHYFRAANRRDTCSTLKVTTRPQSESKSSFQPPLFVLVVVGIRRHSVHITGIENGGLLQLCWLVGCPTLAHSLTLSGFPCRLWWVEMLTTT